MFLGSRILEKAGQTPSEISRGRWPHIFGWFQSPQGPARPQKPTQRIPARLPSGTQLLAMDVTPINYIGFGDIHGPKPYEFIGFGAMDVTKTYKFIGFGDILALIAAGRGLSAVPQVPARWEGPQYPWLQAPKRHTKEWHITWLCLK